MKADSLSRLMLGPYSARYLTLGGLFLKQTHSAPASGYERALDLNTAQASVKYTVNGVEFTREMFVSYPDQLLVIRWKSSRKGALNFSAGFRNPMKSTVSSPGAGLLVMKGQCPSYVPHRPYEKRSIEYDPAIGIPYEVHVKARLTDGETISEGDQLHIKGATEVTMLVSIGTGFNGPQQDPVRHGRRADSAALAPLRKAAGLSYAALLQRHWQITNRCSAAFRSTWGTTVPPPNLQTRASWRTRAQAGTATLSSLHCSISSAVIS